jgi:hypothetical protein
MANNPTTIRFNEEKEKDLIDFFNDKGLKDGVKFLYQHYMLTKDLPQIIISEIKKEIDFGTPRTKSTPKPIQEVSKSEFSFDDDFTANF